MFCENCGKQIADDARFCMQCGVATALGNRTIAQPASAQRSVPPPPPPTQSTAPHQHFEKPEYVPHCRVTKTPEGFVISFNTLNGSDVAGVLGCGGSALLAIFGVYIIGRIGVYQYSSDSAWGHVEFVGLVAIGVMIFMGLRRTRVELTPRAIIIAGKILDREHFGNFFVSGLGGDELAYQYGGRSFNFGGPWGGWHKREVAEVAVALNGLLRATAVASEHQPAPEQLRSARPTDF